MEKRAIGVILTLLGIAALVTGAVYFVQRGNGAQNIKIMIACFVLGLIFFTSGIGLVRSTKDVVKNDEHVS